MWYDKLIQNNSLKQLYKGVPALTDVEINQISLKRDGAEVSIIFELPVYPDNPPAKWNDCNTVSVEISFFVNKSINNASVDKSEIFLFLVSLKNSFFFLTTTLLKIKSPSKFGINKSPLTVSAKFQTSSKEVTEPIKINTNHKALITF